MNVAGQFSDVDATDTLTFSASGLPNGLSINATTGLISGTIVNNASVSGPYPVTLTATDSNGSPTSQNFTWVVLNPAPTAVANTLAVNENSTGTINVLANDTDQDNDTLSVSAVNGLAGNVGSAVTGNNGGTFVISSTGALTFNPGTAFDDLALGETRTTTVNYTASDSQGGTSTATVTVTATGLNDAPTSTTITGQSSNDASSVTLNVAPFFADLDASEALTFAASGLPSGLSINATTGVISGTIAANASVSGPYSVTVTGTDPHGAATFQTFVWTVSNPAPTAVADANATTENAAVSGNVLTNDTDPDGDTLTVAAVGGSGTNVGSAITGSSGGSFTINSNGAYSFNPGTAFDDLAVGQTRTTSVTYTTTDSQGGTSSSTLTITVTGTNDGPVSTSLSDRTSTDGSSVSVNVSSNFSDADSTDVLTFSASGLPAGLSINSSTGVISGTIANNASVSGPYTVTVTATDPTGATTSQAFTWIVTNPAPTAVADIATIAENTNTSGNVLTNDTNPDNDALTVSAVNGVVGDVSGPITGSNGGTFTVNANGTYSFNPGTAFDDLAVGETRTTNVQYTISDGQGGSSTATLTVTVTGANDAPTSTAIANQASLDGAVISFNVANRFSDPDTTNSLAFSASGLPSGLSINAITGLISGTISNNASLSGPYAVTVTATDPAGATTSQTFTWTVTNPAPIAVADIATTGENANTAGNVLTNDTDPDGDALTVASVNGSGTNVSTAVTGTNGGTFTIGSNGTYTFNPGSAFDDLAVGQTRTTSVTYVASDNQGGASSTTLTITVTGANDAPSSTAIANQTSTDAATVSLNVASNFSDPDTTNTLAFSATGLPSGLSINATTGQISGTIASNASVSGPYSVNVTATDNAGATATRSFTWTVTNPAPTATNDTGATTENATTTGNVRTNDTDPDGDALTVSAVNGSGTSVGNAVAGTNGGSFTIGSNGAYIFNPGTAFDDLAVGQTRTTAINYTISDGQGGTSTATVTVTVTGTNDAPITVGTISGQSNVDSATVSVSTSGFFTDADTTDVLSFSASGLPSGLSINATTGVISGTLNSSASASGPYSVIVTANDGNGGTVTQNFAWIVTNPAPIATNDSFSIGEDSASTVVGNTLTNDSDPDGDTFTANVQTNVAGSNGGIFSIAANGNVAFHPNGAFNNLAAGQTRTTTLNYVITDADGATSSATITVTVNGANDAPTSTAIANQTSTDAAVVSLDVAGNFSDPDSANTLTYSASGLPSGLSINATSGLISGTMANNASVTGPYSVTVTATDNASATATRTFTWTVTNPAPTAVADTASTSENATNSGNVLANDTDPDGDTLTVNAVAGVAGNVGNAIAGSNGGTFTIGSNGAYTFNPGTAFDNLAAGQTRTTSVTYTASDSQGGTSSTTLTVTVVGANDAPTSTAIANQASTDSQVVSLNVAGNFSDPDTTNTLTFSASGLPSGLTINATTGVISGTVASNASVSGPYSVTVTATDNAGATAARTFAWTVTNPAPTANNDTNSTPENVSTSGNVLTNDTDPDGDTLSVSAVNGVSDNVGNAVTGSNGGTFTINSTGGYTFNPGTAFDNLALGATRTTAINYTATDGQGGTSIATVTITVTGTNDGPVANDDSVAVLEDTASAPLNLVGNDMDVDGDTLSVQSIAGVTLTPGTAQTISVTGGTVSVSSTGVITFTPTANSVSPVSFDYVVTDGKGGTDIGTVNVSITPVNDAPTLDLDRDDSSGAINSDFATTFIENGTPVVIADADIRLRDVDDSTFAYLGIRLDGFVDGAAELLTLGGVTFVNGTASTVTVTINFHDVEISYDGAAEFRINGAPKQELETTTIELLLSTATYENTLDTPTSTDRLLYSWVNDGDADSNIGTTTISIIPANDAPLLDLDSDDSSKASGSDFETTFTENSSPVQIADKDVSLIDGDDATFVSVAIKLENFNDGASEMLTFSGTTFTIGNAQSAKVSVNGQTLLVDYDGGGNFDIREIDGGEIERATVEAFLANGTYENTSDNPTLDDRRLNIWVNDGDQDSNVAVSTIHVQAANDAPFSTGTIGNNNNADSTSVSLNINTFFADPDNGDVLTFSASNLPTGLSINATTGLISGTITSSASAGGPYSVVITAQDVSGATTSQSLTWIVTNPTPIANNDSFSIGEDSASTVIGNTLTNDSDPDGDTFTANVQTNVAGSNGGLFSIAANGNVTFNPNGAFNNLAAGQTRTTTLNYVLTDANGATSSAMITVTVNGANDAPTSTPIVNHTSADAATVSLNVASNFSDPDTTNTLTFSASGLPSGLSINTTTGLISGTIANNASVTGPYSVTVTATDNAGSTSSRTFTWTVTNPAPTASNDSGATTENATTSGNVITNDTDPDNDTLTVSAVNGVGANVGGSVTGTNGGTFTIGSNGAYSFNPSTAFDDLAVGQTRTTAVSYTATDSQGGTSTATLTITVTGTNDGPVSTAISNQSNSDGAAVTLNVSGNFSDPDTGDVLTFSASGLPSGLSINPTTGVIAGTIANNASVSGPFAVSVTATDPHGATTTRNFTWTVTNPAPTAVADTGATTENANTSGNVITNDTDPDNDVLTVSAVNGSGANVGVAVSGTNGGTFTIGATGTYSFNPGTAFDNLVAGQTRTTSVTYTATDSQGGTSSAILTITVTGTNDAPTSTAIANQTNADGSAVSLNVAGNFSDVDTTNTLTFSATGLPSGLSINPTTGLISGTIANNASVSGPYSVTVTATDNAGATASRTFAWTVTNPAPTAVNDTGATTENASTSGNVIMNDTDPDGDTLTVSAVNGLSGNVGTSVTGTNGGTFTIGSNGAYSFNPGTAFDNLAVGLTRTTSVNYTVSDNQGGTSTATVTVTVTGTNDAPTTAGTIAGQSNVDSSTVSLNVSSFFADADATDLLSLSASGLPTGLSINATSGVISGTINSSASASGPFSVVVTANDGNGGTVNQSFTWIVTNPAPIASNDSFSIGEDAAASIVGNALTNDSDPDGDTFAAGVQTNIAGSNGGVFSIAANGNVTFNPNGAFNNLAAGQTRTTTLNYVITDANGATASATITVTVNGANDAPTSTPIANQTSADAATVSLNVASNFSDPDTTNTLTFSASGLPSGLSISTTTGLISGTIANNASVTGPYSVTVTATDNAVATTSQSFTWTVTNPAPTASNDSGATTENATTSGNVITNDTDPDNDTLTVSAVNGVGANVGGSVTGTNGGTFTIGSNGAYSFNPGTAFDDLAVGQTRTTSVTYTATDSQGGSSSTTLTITVTGTNDAPVSTALNNRTNADGSTVSVNVSGNFSDPDATDTLTFSASGLPAGLSINPSSGIISGTIASNASVSGPFSVSVTATDPHGATTTRNFTWTVTNSAPTAVADAGSTTENANATGNVLTNDTDPDNDTLTVATVNGSGTNVGIAIAGTNGGTFTIDANGDYSFIPGTSFDDLALGQSRSTSVTYTATDSQGGTSSTTLTITVNGTNDAPTSTSIGNQTSSDAASVALNVSGNFADVDAGSVLAYSASGLPSGLTINASTGIISGTIASNASVTSPYSVTVTATDAHGASTSQNFSWTVTNPAPTAVSNSVATTENSSASGNVLTNDTDPDNDTLSVSAVNGLAGGVNSNVAGSAGGTFVIASNGAFTFNPGTTFDDLAFGQTRTTSVSYTATDSQGGSSTTTLTVTVTGTNDAPTSTSIGNQSSVDAANVTLDVSGFFDDLDATDVLTYSASGLPSGLSINAATGIITGTIANNASVTGPYSVDITATDSEGATTTQTLTWAVTNPGPSATADSNATTENSTVSGNVLTNDTDPDTDVLTVSAVNGSGMNVGTSVTGSNGGTFTIASNGAYSFNPGAAFDDLGVGETRTTTVQYTTTDSQGGFSTTTVTIEVDGQNDGPTSTAIGNRTSVDGATVSLNIRSRFSDVDATDVLTFAASGLPTGLSINGTTGVISGTIANNASVTAPYSVTVTATDGSGANTSRIFTWNVTNPAPTASNDSATVAINTIGSGNVLTNDTDPDNDSLTVVAVNGSGSSVGSNVAGTTGGTFAVLANGNYSFDPGTDFDSLAAGESRATSITYTMSDSQGGSSTATVTATVTGLNASPVGTAIANQTSSDAASVGLNVAGNFSDPNASDVLTFAASGLPSGLSINAATGLISGTIANNASLSGPYSVTITATDNHGASTSQSFTWTVTNPAPTATNDSRTTAENSTASGNVLTNDNDPDNDVLTVASVHGVAGNVGNSVTGSSGGAFTIDSNGSYTFNPGTAFDDLAVGQTRSTSVTYLATDSQGGASSAVLVVTVVGVNDAPTSTAIAAQTSADAQAVSRNVAGSFSDADTTDTLTFAASGLPSGLSINTTTGLISGTIANNASVTSPYSVTVTATDNHGATTSQTFAWTVTNPGPTAVADTGTALENGSTTGNVLTNDTDADNDVLTVATVNGSGANVGTSVVGSNGGSFTITNTGGYSFNPGTAFDDLAVGQSRTTSVTYTATDSQGGTSSTTLTITVTGTNDGPVSSSLANRSSADGSTVNVNVSGNFSDPDSSDALTFAASGLPSGLSINPTTGLISGTIANNASVTGPYNVVVTATDPHGATTSQSFIWTVTNPAPTANNDGGATTENSTASGNVLTNDSDPDNDVLTVAAVSGVAGHVAGAVPGSNGGTFTINANGTYSFAPGAAFDNLAVGETRTTSVQYTATDTQGGTSTATLTVTVTGTNDAPTSTTIANQTSVDGASVSLNVAGQFGDVDASNVLTFSASGLPSGLSINSATGLISGTIANNASVSGPYSVTVTATDNSGATTSQMFNWIVTNPAPTASNDSATIASDGTASGNVLTNDTDPDNDALSVSAVNGNGANVGSSIAGTNGGSFSIGNNGAWTFNPGTDFDSLGAGQSQTTSITYTMTDSQGGSSTATVTVTVTGLNSAPTSTPIANQTGVDAGSVNLNVSGNFSDPDSGDTPTFSASGLPSGLSINPTTGVISGTIASNASVAGPYSVTITATDSGNATTSQSFIWTVTNPAPTASNDTRTTTENSTASGNVLTNDTDPDNDTLTVSAVNGVNTNVGNAVAGSNGGTFTIGSNGAYLFNPGTAFDNLAVGQTRTTSVTYTATDSQGGTSTATLTITVTGTNDGPISTAISNQSSSDGSSVNVNVSGNFSDPDTGDALTFSASGLPSGLSINPATGIISGTIANNASVSGPFAVSVTATDPHGATTTRNFTWTVTNPAPTAVADARTTSENTSTSGNVLTNDTDPDNDVLTVSAVNGIGTNVGAAVTGTNGGTFTIGSTGTYTFNPGSAFDDLAVGQTRTTSVTYMATDSQGGTSSTTLTITVTGANDGPTSTPIAAQSSSDAQSISLNVSGNFADRDAGAVFAYSASGLPSGLSINAATGIVSGTIASNASVTGPYSVTVTATDEHGAATSQTFAWAVSNPGPTSVADTLTTSENSSISGNVLTNDTDPDNDTLSVASVNGVTTNVGAAVAGSNGGTFVINSNGSYTFNPGTAFNDLAVGQSRTSTVTYAATDSQGGTSSTTLTITVTGSNDAPVPAAISTQNSSDGSPVVLNVAGSFTDPDTTDPLTYSATGLPSGLSIHPTTGVISGTIANNASVSGPYSVVVTAADPHGGTTSQTLVWNVTNPAPTATNDAATVNENSTSSGNVLTNDTDPDGDTLTVQFVNGLNSNVSNSVAGTNGGTFTIQPNGSYVFNPGASFDDLAAGEIRTSSVTYTMTDNQGGTSTATVTVTVTGLNDAPTSTPIATQNGIDNTPVALNVSTSFGDPDASDPLTFSASNLPPGLSINPTTGIITGTIAGNASVSGPYSVTITAVDPHGGTTSQTFTWNVSNPAPTATNDSATTSENASTTGNVLTNDTDPDGDTLVVSAVNGSPTSVGTPISGSQGGTFTIQPNGSYTFQPGTAFDGLAVGQTRTTSITYTVNDNQGGTSIATVTVTVVGRNDAPTSTPIGTQSANDGDSIALSIASHFGDPDTIDTLTFGASNLPPGLTIHPSTGLIHGTINSNASVSGPYSVTVTATDPHGATTSRTFTWNVANPAPTATNDLATTQENSSITGNVLTNDSDTDNDALVVSSVNGSSSNLGRPISGTTGGTFVIQSNGGYSFNPGTSFDHLGVGQSIITSVSYTVSDGQGGTSTATVSITVTGTNDTPIVAAIPAQDSTGRDVINLDVSSFFSDAETHEPLTFAASNLPPGLNINPTTGLITGSIDPNAASTGPYSVTVTGTDIHGASVTTSFQWNVENPDLMVLVNDSVPSVNAGDTVVFSVNYANISNRDATGVVITQTLPAHTTFNSAASTPGWIDNGDGTYSYALGNVDAHDNGTILFAVTVADTLPSGIDQTSTSSTIADDGSHGNDLTPFNNIASDVTSIDARPDYRITIDDSKVLVYRGETLTYNIHVSNNGSQNGTGVVVTSYFPPEVLGSITASHGGVINTLAGTITWNLGTLPAGDDLNLSVAAVIPLSAPSSVFQFSQYVVVTDDGSNGADRTPSNNSATDSNFLMSFGFDSFGNRSEEGFGMIPPSAPPLTTRLMPLPVDPIFSGITEPGTTLVGKIYDQHGNLIGERQVLADSSGNWMMSFPGSMVMENPHRMEVQQTAAIQSGVQSGFNFRRYFHPTAHSSIFFTTELTVNEVFRRSAYQMIDQLHEGNQSPYGFNWCAMAYELATASSNAGEG